MGDQRDQDRDPWFEIAEEIKSSRKRAGLTRQQLAVRVGVSRGTIFNWESGKRIPIEKCASLADGLGVDPDALLALHPEVPKRGAPAPDIPDDEAVVRFTRRELTVFGVVGVALFIGMAFLTWSTARAGCTEVGAGNPTVAPQLRAAYEDAGGRLAVGCPVEDVRKWGPGLSQSLDGGDLGAGSILALDRFGEAFVFSGELWESFRWISDGASTDVAGYPVTPPLSCDGTYLVGLSGGSLGAGALVQHAGGTRYEAVNGGVWVAYSESGGPGGPLGRPVSVTVSDDGTSAEFEHGTISAPYGSVATVSIETSAAVPLDLDSCTEVPLREAAGI